MSRSAPLTRATAPEPGGSTRATAPEPGGSAAPDDHDPDALGAELVRLYDRLWWFAAVTGDADLDPDDLVQEAFARVFRIARTNGRPQHLDAYLRRTIFNLIASERRTRGRARTAAARHRDEPEGRPAIYPSDTTVLLREAAPIDRALVYLVDIEGSPIVEVAADLGLSAAAARARLSRARRRLHTLITTDTDPHSGSRRDGGPAPEGTR